MALMLDTRFFITHTFPATDQDRIAINKFVAKIASEDLHASSVSIVEYMKVAGTAIGRDAAKTRMKIWIKNGLGIVQLDEELAFEAGELATSHRSTSLGDLIIGSAAKKLGARVVTDDLDYQNLGLKTLWFR